ncbi:MAG: prolyl oligopeptidase family serine peptidase [Flavobacteriaceae bacterium]|nr:S9 family peptidase [Flavobacteriaceae bacterium]MDG2063177.1 prolyl oligopeptidase family serine peptidase [Flavobacteriaceae bacterium]
MKKTLTALIIVFLGCQSSSKKQVNNYDIKDFFNNISVYGGSFSSDEERLIYSSNESGIYNVYEVGISSGAITKLSSSELESFFVQSYVPASNDFIYTADKGGNEINHLYLQKRGGQTIDLTPGENEKSIFYKWSQDNTFLYYLSNKRDSKYFDLYKMDIGRLESRMVYENKDNLSLSSISNNEQYLLLSERLTTSENKFYLFDIIKGEKKEISTAPGSYSAAGFSNDNKGFYYITDVGKEFTYLNKYDIKTSESTVVFETNWDVMYSYSSKNEKYRIIGINEDGKNSIQVIDSNSNKPIEFPSFENADITGVSFSESEQKIRLSVGSSKMPNDLFVYDMETKSMVKLTNSLNKEIDPKSLVKAEVVRYQSFDGLEVPAIYYKPLIASSQNKVPAMVWVHGGPGGQSRMNFNPLIQYLTNSGYAILAVNNRGSSGYGKNFYKMDDKNHGDKDLQDCIWGKKWLQQQDYIDPERIGIIGGSYGGYMTMAAMTFTPDEFKAGVNIFGVTNWIRTLKSIPPFWEASRKALYNELGDPYSQDSIRLKKISPLFHAKQVKNPVMVLQGANDPRVLQVESDEIVAELKKNEIPVEYVIFEDEGHGFRKKENQIKGYGKIKDFLDFYLKSPASFSKNKD